MSKKTKWYVHVNQHVIRRNIKADTPEPPILVKRGRSGRSSPAFVVSLPPSSRVISRSDGSAILDCGARVIIECDEEPVIEA